MKSSKIEVDIVSDTGISVMLLLVMITKMMIILLLVLLLLLLATNESNNCNCNNNVLIIKIIIKMKSVCALKWKTYFFELSKKENKRFSLFAFVEKKNFKSGCRYCKYWNLAKVKLPFFILFLFHFWFVFKRNWPSRD